MHHRQGDCPFPRPVVFLILLVLQSLVTGSPAPRYIDLLRKNNPHPLQPINLDWQVTSGPQAKSETVTLPYLTTEPVDQLIFQKKFYITDSLRAHALRIHFLGICGVATVKINSKLVRKHINLLSSFSADIPADLLQPAAENTLELIITSPAAAEQRIPNLVQLYRAKALLGISREIYLEFIPPDHIGGFKYKWTGSGLHYSYTISCVKSLPADQTVSPNLRVEEKIYIPGTPATPLGKEEILPAAAEKSIQRDFTLSRPLAWSPQSPVMYWLEITLTTPGQPVLTYRFPVYYRQIQFTNAAVQLNGSRFLIKGICYHEPQLDRAEKALTADAYYDKVSADFQMIRDLGFNTIRFPVDPPHPYCAYLADSLGLFILVENGIWRLPAVYLGEDYLVQSSRYLAEEILTGFEAHPSFLALGLGQELPLSAPQTQKYITSMTGYLAARGSFYSYVSPLDYTQIPDMDRIDFLLISKYDRSIFNLLNSPARMNELTRQKLPVVLGTVGFAMPLFPESDTVNPREIQLGEAQRVFKSLQTSSALSGFIWQSFQDWPAAVPATIGQKIAPDQWVYRDGLLSWKDERRDLYQKIPSFMNYEFTEIYETPAGSKPSNFFSLATFFSLLAFLLYYRRNFRFKENIKRSLAHPYGFFVDLRDRRIISILNSTVIGIFSNLMVAILLAALVYYYRQNLWMEEIASTILVVFQAKETYLAILNSPGQILLFILCGLYLAQFVVALFLKLLNLFTEEKTRFRQLVAMCNWAGAPLLLLVPVSMFCLQVLPFANVPVFIFYLLVLFFAWYNYRLGSGIRVFFIMRTYKVLLLVSLIYIIPLGIFILLTGRNYDIIGYLSLLAGAGHLF